MNSCVTRPVMCLRWNIAAMATAKANPAKLAFISMTYQFLINTKRVDPQSILSFGQSLGTTVAADLAAHRQVGGLILEAPLPSASRAASKLFGFFQA
jgi:dienelactone hydrolase